MKKKQLISYLKNYLSFIFFFLLLIFLINCVIDPLWYFKGNKISNINYVYNERLTKFNNFYYNDDNKNKDCLIFGSSISTTINEKNFIKNSCYNFSFSAGAIEEYVLYLNYLKFIGYLPKKIYIELPIFMKDEKIKIYKKFINENLNSEIVAFIPPVASESLLEQYNLIKYNEKKKVSINVPSFIEYQNPPDKFWDHYFTFNSFIFSIKSLFKISNYTNAYNENFVGFVRKSKSNFNKNFKKIKFNKNDLEAIILNRKLLLNIFDEVYDFSVPNKKINDSINTYDGSHYYEHFISLIAFSMENLNYSYGLKVNDLDFDLKYLESYEEYEKS